jgi:hypothetical protein
MHRTNVILWEWTEEHGESGVLSTADLEVAQRARLDERLDRIEELDSLTFESVKGLIFPWKGQFKKMKVRGNVALRPILVLGPFDRKHEVTFLALAKERDGALLPRNVEDIAADRLAEVLANPRERRKRYERD